jgi:hypothetical protein
MGYAENAAWIEKKNDVYKVLIGKSKGKRDKYDLTIDGKIIWNKDIKEI